MQTVSITNDSLTHIFKMFPFETFRVKVTLKTLHTINVTVHLPFKIKLFTNKSSKDNCTRKKFFQTYLTLLHPGYCVSDNPVNGTS